jgi:hypothetical protein
MKELFLIVSVLSLFSPVGWESRNDRKGDKDKRKDTFVRALLGALSAFINHITGTAHFWIALNMAAATFTMFFDYLINFILLRNKTVEEPAGKNYHWFTYMGKRGDVDNIPFWRNMNPWVRFYIRVGYFLASLFIYLRYGLHLWT